MNSLGAGGLNEPYLVNAANALTFSLMVLSCFFSSIIVHHTSIRFTLFLGTLGFAPYAAGLYLYNKNGTEWFVLFGAALCGLSAGIFWMAQMAVAMSYPEPYNQGRFLGLWLSFCVGGQILGGAISLGLNARRSEGGKIGDNVYLVFIAMQALAPFSALLLTPPEKVQRRDGVTVRLNIPPGNQAELKRVIKLFSSRDFLLIVPLTAASYYTEAVMFTFVTFFFSVRARALCSLLSAIVAIICGNIFGAYLDMKSITLRKRARIAFIFTMAIQGGWWVWMTILVHRYQQFMPVYDWNDGGFASPFILFLALVGTFQLNVMFMYVPRFLCFLNTFFVIWYDNVLTTFSMFLASNIAKTQAEVVRTAGLLRGVQSAVQAISVRTNLYRVPSS